MSKSKFAFLVTGAAGFIGSALSMKLLEKGETVIGIDNLNSYYNRLLKIKRIETIKEIGQSNLYSSETTKSLWHENVKSISR